MTVLKCDWGGAIRRTLHTATGPAYRVQHAADCAQWFTAKWADWAEHAGMQPAHLLGRLDGREGLAWRWSGHCGWWEPWWPAWDVMCWPRRGIVVGEPDNEFGIPLVYRFCPDGGVEIVMGEEYTDIMISKFQLDELPSVRSEALKHG